MVCIGIGAALTSSVALAAPAAAALAVQAAVKAAEAANVVAEAALEAVAGAGAKLEAEGEEQFAAETTSRRWHMAASEAVGMNATIRTLATRARRAGAAVTLPNPLALDGRSLDAVSAWLIETAPRVQRAQEALAGAALSAQRQRLMADLPIAVDRSSVAEALRRYQETLVRRAPAAEQAAADLSWVDADVQAALAGMDPDAAVDDRQKALAAAARVARQTDEADAGAYLDALERLVRKEINPRAADARRAARWLEALDHPAVAGAVAADPTLPHAGVARELAQVVAGAADLGPDLRRRAEAAARWAAEATRIAYRADLLSTFLVESGYRVTPDGPGRLQLEHADWSGHTATIRLDREGGVHAMLVGVARARGDEATAEEAARHGALARDVDAAVHAMTHEGVHGLFVQVGDVQYGHATERSGTTATVGHPAPRARQHP